MQLRLSSILILPLILMSRNSLAFSELSLEILKYQALNMKELLVDNPIVQSFNKTQFHSIEDLIDYFGSHRKDKIKAEEEKQIQSETLSAAQKARLLIQVDTAFLWGLARNIPTILSLPLNTINLKQILYSSTVSFSDIGNSNKDLLRLSVLIQKQILSHYLPNATNMETFADLISYPTQKSNTFPIEKGKLVSEFVDLGVSLGGFSWIKKLNDNELDFLLAGDPMSNKILFLVNVFKFNTPSHSSEKAKDKNQFVDQASYHQKLVSYILDIENYVEKEALKYQIMEHMNSAVLENALNNTEIDRVIVVDTLYTETFNAMVKAKSTEYRKMFILELNNSVQNGEQVLIHENISNHLSKAALQSGYLITYYPNSIDGKYKIKHIQEKAIPRITNLTIKCSTTLVPQVFE